MGTVRFDVCGQAGKDEMMSGMFQYGRGFRVDADGVMRHAILLNAIEKKLKGHSA